MSITKDEFLQLFAECIQDGSIKVQVSIAPKRVEKGWGEWNETQTCIYITNVGWSEPVIGNVELVGKDREDY